MMAAEKMKNSHRWPLMDTDKSGIGNDSKWVKAMEGMQDWPRMKHG